MEANALMFTYTPTGYINFTEAEENRYSIISHLINQKLVIITACYGESSVKINSPAVDQMTTGCLTGKWQLSIDEQEWNDFVCRQIFDEDL